MWRVSDKSIINKQMFSVEKTQLADSPSLMNEDDQIEVDFQSMSFYSLLEEVQTLMADRAKLSSQIPNTHSKNRVRAIASYVVKKLSCKSDFTLKERVGMLTIFSILGSSVQKYPDSLPLKPSFYSNLCKCAREVHRVLTTNVQGGSQASRYKLLNSFLYCLSNLCEFRQNNPGINLNRIFCIEMLDILLELRLPDNVELLRHYRIMATFIESCTLDQAQQEKLVRSLCYHLGICSSNKNTRTAIVFLLNRILKHKHAGFQALEFQQSVNVWKRVQQIMIKETNPQISKLSLNLLEKLMAIDPRLWQQNTCEEVMEILKKSKALNEAGRKPNSVFKNAIELLSHQKCLELYRLCSQPGPMENLDLQVLEILLRKPHINIVMDFVGSGVIAQLFQGYRSLWASGPQKMLLQKVLNNAVKGAEILNRQLGAFLRKICREEGLDLSITHTSNIFQ